MNEPPDRLVKEPPDWLAREPPDRLMNEPPARLVKEPPAWLLKKPPDRLCREPLEPPLTREGLDDWLLREPPDRIHCDSLDCCSGEPLESPPAGEDSDERFPCEPTDGWLRRKPPDGSGEPDQYLRRIETVSLLQGEPDCLSPDRPGSSLASERDPTLVGDPPDRLQLDDAPKGTLKDEPPDDEVPDDLALDDRMELDDYSFSNEPCDRKTADSLQQSRPDDGSLTGEHLDDPRTAGSETTSPAACGRTGIRTTGPDDLLHRCA